MLLTRVLQYQDFPDTSFLAFYKNQIIKYSLMTTMISTAVEDDDDWTAVPDPEEELKPGQFRAHVSEVERFER